MAQEIFFVENVKCAGCAKAIQEGLQDIPALSRVEVDIPSGQVTLNGSELSREEITAKLARLGYPVVSQA